MIRPLLHVMNISFLSLKMIMKNLTPSKALRLQLDQTHYYSNHLKEQLVNHCFKAKYPIDYY